MTGLLIPILLAVGGLIAALAAHRGVQRGGSRFYQLERDALLRRASFTLLASMVLFIGSIGLLIFQQNTLTAQIEDGGFVEAVDGEGEVSAEVDASGQSNVAAPLASPEVIVQDQPPTIAIEPTPTEDPNQPTPTPTAIVRRAEVANTGASGAYLRGAASTAGEELEVLDEGTLVTLLDEDEIDADSYIWVKVRTLGGTEGYVAKIFLEEFVR